MRPAKTSYAFPAPLERRRLRVAGVSAFAAFIDLLALNTFMAFFAGITFLAFVGRCRLGGAAALAVFIALNVDTASMCWSLRPNGSVLVLMR